MKTEKRVQYFCDVCGTQIHADARPKDLFAEIKIKYFGRGGGDHYITIYPVEETHYRHICVDCLELFKDGFIPEFIEYYNYRYKRTKKQTKKQGLFGFFKGVKDGQG